VEAEEVITWCKEVGGVDHMSDGSTGGSIDRWAGATHRAPLPEAPVVVYQHPGMWVGLVCTKRMEKSVIERVHTGPVASQHTPPPFLPLSAHSLRPQRGVRREPGPVARKHRHHKQRRGEHGDEQA
jgi:hypothetical protein